MDALKKKIIPVLNKLPYVKTLRKLLDEYEQQTAYPPGHYYSPIPNLDEVLEHKGKIFHRLEPLAIELDKEGQKKLLNQLLPYLKDFNYSRKRESGKRYFIPEAFFTYTDALSLFGIVRHLKPKSIVEIGSGYSTALLLDINETYFNNSIKITSIDPYDDRLNQLARKEDFRIMNFKKSKVQDIDLTIFEELEENDLLFIDSSHVAKTGSDLNYILFNILPKLKKGVIIHFHDVYYPFEYPENLILDERLAWNEAYFLKAFLMYNSDFRIYYFTDFIHKEYNIELKGIVNSDLEDTGTSLYIKKIKQP